MISAFVFNTWSASVRLISQQADEVWRTGLWEFRTSFFLMRFGEKDGTLRVRSDFLHLFQKTSCRRKISAIIFFEKSS